jgi:hypothetical protein
LGGTLYFAPPTREPYTSKLTHSGRNFSNFQKGSSTLIVHQEYLPEITVLYHLVSGLTYFLELVDLANVFILKFIRSDTLDAKDSHPPQREILRPEKLPLQKK